MIKFLVNRPIAVLISFVALTLLGFVAFLFIPASLLPNIDIPTVLVKINEPSRSTKQIEQNITTPIRNNLLQLNGVEDIESISSDGKGVIKLKFAQGTNISTAFIEVNEKVDVSMNQLPKEMIRPTVIKLETANIPVYNLNISNKANSSVAGISNLVREVIKRRIERLPEVAMVDLSGYTQSQIQLQPKESYLKSIGLEQNKLIDAFKENKIDLGNILVKDGHYQYYLKFVSDFQNISSIENIPLNIQGRLFKLGDLAKVSYGNAPENGAFFNNGKRAINLAIVKQQGIKMNDLKKSFSTLLFYLRKDYPQLNFEISQDQTSLLDYAVGNLWQDLALGGFLAFILMLVFVRKIRASLLIGITIPLSLALSQLGFYLFGISLNVISLGGLILGLAMIIDNSIVVIDNINRLRETGLDLETATINGTNEVIRPLITSVLTNCAVFVPLIFMSGLAGAIFYDQAISIVIGVVSSLIVAIVLLPPLYSVIYSKHKEKQNFFEIKSYVHVTGWYEFGLKKVFRYPLITCVVVGCMLCFSVLLFGFLRKDRLPPITRYDTDVTIDWNEDIDLMESEKRTDFLLTHTKGITENSVWLGEQQYLSSQVEDLEYNQEKLYLKVNNADSLQKKQQQIATLLSKNYPLAVLSLSPSKNAFDEIFADELPPIRLNINTDQNTIPSIAQTKLLIDKLQQLLPNSKINPVSFYNKTVLKVNPEKSALYKVSINDIGRKVASVLQSEFIDNYQDVQALVPIVMVGQTQTSISDMLAQTYVSNADGVNIPLRILVEIENESEYKYTTAGVQGAYYPINIYSTQPKADLQKIENLFKKDFKSLMVEYKGSYFDNNKLVGEMGIILVVSILLLYFILSAQFESLVQPLFILVELPIALSGAFIFLHMADNSLNLMSMIGVVVMCGLIINDSILKIDAINQLRREGVSLMEAIYEGGHKRLKPIVMISLTSIGSLLPTLFMKDLGSELQKPLALALIGGMFVGLFVSLFFVPLLYWFVYRKKGEEITFIKHEGK